MKRTKEDDALGEAIVKFYNGDNSGYELIHNKVRALAIGKLRSGWKRYAYLWDDVASEICLSVVERLRYYQYDSDKAHAGAFLNMLVQSATLNILRSKQVRRNHVNASLTAPATKDGKTPAQTLVAKDDSRPYDAETLEALQEFLDTELTPTEKIAWEHWASGKSYRNMKPIDNGLIRIKKKALAWFQAHYPSLIPLGF